jgi:transcriptional regulator with XRE-family HTH domain
MQKAARTRSLAGKCYVLHERATFREGETVAGVQSRATASKTMTTPSSATIGGFLRTLRTSRRMTMAQAAERAGLHRITLHRWEKDLAQPRLSELTALLSALEVSEVQKRSALGLMDAPRAARMVWLEVRQMAAQTGVSEMPHGGDLLRAMRLRQGVSLEEAARHVAVTGGTLRRWEKMEVWPSPEQLHRLCFALHAHDEEIIALTVGRFSQRPRIEKTSLNALHERFHNQIKVERSITGYDPLFELAYLQMEADAWPLALQSVAGKQMLIEIYAHHAQQLSTQERLTEAGNIAERAQELMTGSLKVKHCWLYAVIVSARSAILRGERPAPERGLEALRPWLAEERWPEMKAWILADMAKYVSMRGDTDVSLILMEQACQLAEKTGLDSERSNRNWDKAEILLKAGRPEEALGLLVDPEPQGSGVSERINVALLRSEAYLATGDLAAARDWLQGALDDINAYRIDYRRPRAARLAARL